LRLGEGVVREIGVEAAPTIAHHKRTEMEPNRAIATVIDGI